LKKKKKEEEEGEKNSLKNKKEKPRWSDLDFLKLAAASVAEAPAIVFFNLSLRRRSFPADWDLGLVISILLASLPRIAGPKKCRLQSAGKEERNGH
jgi:hypothetical protein